MSKLHELETITDLVVRLRERGDDLSMAAADALLDLVPSENNRFEPARVLPRSVLDEITSLIAENSGLLLTRRQLLDLLAGHPTIVTEILAWGPRSTMIRERITDLIAQATVGKPWPIRGDRADIVAFAAEVQSKGVAAGYQLVRGKRPQGG